jgi:hypothetical protein
MKITNIGTPHFFGPVFCGHGESIDMEVNDANMAYVAAGRFVPEPEPEPEPEPVKADPEAEAEAAELAVEAEPERKPEPAKRKR